MNVKLPIESLFILLFFSIEQLSKTQTIVTEEETLFLTYNSECIHI